MRGAESSAGRANPTASESALSSPSRTAGRSLAGDGWASATSSVDLFQLLFRQRWLIIFCTTLGMTAAIGYAVRASVWYRSGSRVLISQRSAGLSDSGTGTDSVDDDVLANHMGLIRSRRIIAEALDQYGLGDLPSITSHLNDDHDAIDYVIEHIGIVRGGEGSAKKAAIMNVTFDHTDPDDAKTVLTAIMKRYESYIIAQVEDVMGQAGRMINDAKSSLEADLETAEAEHLTSLQNAPLFFQGEGSSNIYQDRFRRLSEELLELDIQKSTLQTRLDRVQNSLREIERGGDASDHLDKLALIDGESLERLGVFAGLQVSASNSAEFKAALPAKVEEARAQVTHLLALNSERQKLAAVFGENHPRIRELSGEIELVRQFVEKSREQTTPESSFGASDIKPDSLLRAYIGFIEHDLATLEERKKELHVLAKDAEAKAKELMEYELRDSVLRKRISRLEAIFDSTVVQLESINQTSGLGGYLYELLEVPRVGKKIWPKLPLSVAAGCVMGGLLGCLLALAMELQDSRFRTAGELDAATGLTNLGHVGSLATIDQGLAGLMAAESSPEAEAFRLARTMLLTDIRGERLKSIGFTSSMQGDGKSTIVANFAQSLASIGLHTVVVDADLRRPSQHRYLELENTRGMVDVLAGNLPLAQAILETKIPSLFAIPAGADAKRPAELLESSNFDRVIESLYKRFDVVLVDLPPILAVSDPAVVLPRLSGGILVVRAAKIRREQLRQSLGRLSASGVRLIGAMYNVVGTKSDFDNSGGRYGYYRDGYAQAAAGHAGATAAGKPATQAARPAVVKPVTTKHSSPKQDPRREDPQRPQAA